MGGISRCYRWPLQWTAGSFFQVGFRMLCEMLLWSHLLYLTWLKPMQKGQVTCPKWQSDWVVAGPLLPAPRPPLFLSPTTQKLNSPQWYCLKSWLAETLPEAVEKHDFCPHQQACFPPLSPLSHLVQQPTPAFASAPFQRGQIAEHTLQRGLFLLLTHLIG